jgi:Tfp pilus assembly protein PilO
MRLFGRELQRREKVLLAITLLVVVGGLGYRFVYSPEGAGGVQTTISRSKELAAFEQLAVDLKKAESLAEGTRQYKEKHFGNPDAKLAKPGEVRSVMAHIEELAGKSGVGFGSWTPSALDRTADPPHVDIKLEGGGKYPELVKFLHALEHADYLVQAISLSVSGGKDVKVNLQVRIYVQPEKPRGRRAYPGLTS